MEKIDWWSLVLIIELAISFGTIGFALPETISRMIGGNITYGTWCSYVIAILFFWLMARDVEVIKNGKR